MREKKHSYRFETASIVFRESQPAASGFALKPVSAMNEIGTAEGAGWGQGLRHGPVIGEGGGGGTARLVVFHVLGRSEVIRL
jgi:hypothetical protein